MKTLSFIFLPTICSNLVQAQNYSAWINDNAHAELKVKYAKGNRWDGRKLIFFTGYKHKSVQTRCNCQPLQ